MHQERSFFGVLRVEISRARSIKARALLHGSTQHGVQVIGNETKPTSYYGSTPVSASLSRGPSRRPGRIGVIGLGAGTLATYGRAGDHVSSSRSIPR
jgi:hypothetical protein